MSHLYMAYINHMDNITAVPDLYHMDNVTIVRGLYQMDNVTVDMAYITWTMSKLFMSNIT
jgi:hypothetical protein